jgi:hypothetical protein
MMEGVNSTMKHYKNLVNVTMYPQYNNNMIIKNVEKKRKKKNVGSLLCLRPEEKLFGCLLRRDF